jgi:hypothetical protein
MDTVKAEFTYALQVNTGFESKRMKQAAVSPQCRRLFFYFLGA